MAKSSKSVVSSLVAALVAPLGEVTGIQQNPVLTQAAPKRTRSVQPTDRLVTGNARATKPGKADRYIVTQECFDSAFDAGRAYAGAYHAAAQALQPLLAPLSGLRTPEAVAQWREIQRAFTLGMAEEREIDPDSARKAFNRLTDYLGLDKPQTAAAAAKQAARKASAPAGAASGASEAEDSPKAGEADAAVARVAMELSAMEAHLIGMLRAGKFFQAAQAVADMAAAK